MLRILLKVKSAADEVETAEARHRECERASKRAAKEEAKSAKEKVVQILVSRLRPLPS